MEQWDCIESIWIKDHRIQKLKYHQLRMEKTYQSLYGNRPMWKLPNLIHRYAITSKDIKCRVLYNKDNIHVDYHHYTRNSIKSLKIVKAENIRYSIKFFHRAQLDELYAKRGECDEIMIINNGFVSDAYYYNLVFENGNRLVTPSDNLLPGVMRSYYLAKGIILAKKLSMDDVFGFKSVHLINALNPLGKINIPVERIYI
jgi:4-amino-4-deoxychorismate lyase